jgi:effector-binding domain-containing protein
MKALKILLYIVLTVVASVIIFGLVGRKDYHVERSIEIDAPANTVYEYVRFFKNFNQWSPWSGLDPHLVSSVTGTDGEVGATYSWSGNKDVGKGKQIIRSLNPSRIETELVFVEPWEDTAPSFMAFEPKGKKTKVTWGMDMHVAFPWNGMAMFTNMDAAIGKDYAKGLANLKKVTEAIAHKKYGGYEVAMSELPQHFYIGTRKSLPISKIPQEYTSGFGGVMAALQKNGIEPASAPAGLYWAHNDSTQIVDMAAAIPIASSQPVGKFSSFPLGGKALVIDYFGNYDDIIKAHQAMDMYITEKGLTQLYPVVEQYITDPLQEPDTAKWLTTLIYFVQ